jgi:hypothetical protein
MTLHPSDIERIEADANSKWPLDENVPPTKYTLSRNALMLDFRLAYVSGAQAEAVRGREMAKGFAEWIYFNGWKHVYGRPGFHHPTGDDPNKIHTTAELLDLFLNTQKQKG